MKLHYDRETDSLYIDLNARPSVDSREVQEGVVIDLDEKGQIVGIDIQHASQILDQGVYESESESFLLILEDFPKERCLTGSRPSYHDPLDRWRA